MINAYIHDHVYSEQRYRLGQNPMGYVCKVLRDEVWIKYLNTSKWLSQYDSEFGLPGGDIESMSREEFEDCRVSSEWTGFKYEDHRSRGRRYHEIGMDDRRD